MLIDRFPELANIAVGAMFFGQFLSERPFSLGLASVSLVAWVALVAMAFALAAVEEKSEP